MDSSILTDAERSFLRELQKRGVPFMLVGMSAALIQGARGATEDIDLWFADLADPSIGEAVRRVGGIWISGSFGMGPPRIGGDALSERFDVVAHMHGLASFDEEFTGAVFETIDGITLPLLPLARILASKRATNRPKDQAAIPALEDALVVQAEVTED